jgi:hypothetical protein
VLIPDLLRVDHRHAEKHLGRQSGDRLNIESTKSKVLDVKNRTTLALVCHNLSQSAVKFQKGDSFDVAW